ncbi:MAG: 2-C-methyl-D-erythritol 2,4-cyclodiphosphate synthase [Candidatus Omnitrophica bacterium]|nr:2-C-methyl-D-erythritol 2,4-cyclodiphosphate synthase [Candidatus Omnitrophota bacterium]
MEYKVGIGYDIHRFVKGRKLMLGGVEIPHTSGLLGHSDADVLLHAVCDALLGAMNLGDIGEHFPDNDPEYFGVSSVELLRKVTALAGKKGFKISNIDATLILEEPKLSLYKTKMQKKICAVAGLKEGSVSVKAKTNEGLGPVGEKRAAACYAVAAVIKRGKK